jgi:hypothetical protein
MLKAWVSLTAISVGLSTDPSRNSERHQGVG